MVRRAFYSFHYQPDCSRAGQIRNMGVLEGNAPASDNDWEAVKKGGDAAIQKWIDGQLHGKSVAIVLIGSATAGRKWINYEIKAAWDAGKGVMGIYIHNLKDLDGNQASQGSNPFNGFTVGTTSMASIVKAYLPPYSDSKLAYGHIKDNLSTWIEDAIAIRAKY